MCPQLFSCPLCARPSFESLDSLRIGLVSVATRPLTCPVCSETLLGIDKLTIHLFGHTITQETQNVSEEVEVKRFDANLNLNNSNIAEKSPNDLIIKQPSQLFNQSNLIKLDENIQVYKRPSKATNSCTTQAEVSQSINNLHQREVPQLPSTWPNDLLVHADRENSTCNIKPSVNTESCENILSSQSSSQLLAIKVNDEMQACELTLHIPETRHSTSSIELEDNKNKYQASTSTTASNTNGIQILPQSKPLINITEKTERCDICGFHFPDHNILVLHKQLVHMIAEKDVNVKPEALLKSYPCHLCHKVFKMRGSLMIHMRVAHTGYNSGLLSNEKDPNYQVGCENGFNCPTCGKNFRKEQHVTQHLKTHEAKQWECDICSKMFTTKYFLKKHKRLHSGEMPYKCDICGKTFTFQQSYHKHRLYHKDDKPHTCATCGRSFKELSTLHNHERIHTGEKPFACETCGKCFRQRVSYLVHRRIHTGVMPYTCNVCGKCFRYKVSQRTHKCPAVADISEQSLEQSDSHSLSITQSTNDKSDLSPVTKEETMSIISKISSLPLTTLDHNQVNKFILVVDNDGRTVLKRENDLNAHNTSNKTNNNDTKTVDNHKIKISRVKVISQDNSDDCPLADPIQQNGTENFYTIAETGLPGVNVNLRSDLSSPSMEMKQLRLSSPTNEDTFMRPINPFQENPCDLHKDIKHAIDGILKERHVEDDNPPLSLETINEESFKQLLYEIDKKT